MPNRRSTAPALAIPVSNLLALHARIQDKAASYISTASAYKGKCHHAKKVELLTHAKVAEMIGGWLKEEIDRATDQAGNATAAGGSDPAAVAEVAPVDETDRGPDSDGAQRAHQAPGPVDVQGLRQDHDGA